MEKDCGITGAGNHIISIIIIIIIITAITLTSK